MADTFGSSSSDSSVASSAPPPSTVRGPLVVGAVASIGAGAIHAVAAGAHDDTRTLVWTFALVAAAQIGWGALALARPSRAVAAAGAALGIGALCGWAMAVVTGIPWIEGLDVATSAGRADGLAAALAAVALLACTFAAFDLPAPRAVVPVLATVALLAAVPGMVAAATHTHDHGDEVAAGHAHTDGTDDGATHDEADHDDAAHDDAGSGEAAAGDHADHEAAVVPPQPYDPALPIDLSGVEGVTPQQQAAAENLIAITLLRLPQFADPAAAEAAGYHSIGDSVTGYEHYIDWTTINDDVFLDPDQPESLVYQVINGQKTLVAAMYMLPESYTLDTVPELGGRLTQWHVHDNLCYTLDPVAPRVAGLRSPGGPCPEGQKPGRENPMIHVWIVPHECGPFAALEGVGGGTIAEGEERWCDHAHGA